MLFCSVLAIVILSLATFISAFSMVKDRNPTWMILVVFYGLFTYMAINNTIKGLW